MKFVSLSLREFRSFESCDIDFPDGLIGVRGANGSGKTTLAEAIGWALFGKLRPGSKVGDVKRQGATGPTSVELTFRLDETVYRVKRIVGGAATLWIGDADEPESTQTRATNVAVARELGITWESFQRTVFARQKDVAALDPSATKANRTLHVERLLGLSRYREAAAASKVIAADIAAQVVALREEEPPLEELRQELADAREAASSGSPAVTEAQDAANEAREAEDAATAAVETELERVAESTRLGDQIASKRSALTELEGDLTEKLTQATERAEQQVALDNLLKDAPDLTAARTARERWDALAACQAELDELGPAGEEPDKAEAPERATRLAAVRKELEDLTESVVPDVDALQRRVTALEACRDLPDAEEAATRVAELAVERDAVRVKLGTTRERIDTDVAHLEALDQNRADEPCPICLRPYGDDFGTIRAKHEARIAEARDVAAELEHRCAELDESCGAAEQLAARATHAAASLVATSGLDDLDEARAAHAAATVTVQARTTTLADLRSERDALDAAVADDVEAERAGAEQRASRAAAQARFAAAAAALGVTTFDAAARADAQGAEARAEELDSQRRDLQAALAATAGLADEITKLQERSAARQEEIGAIEASLTDLALDPDRIAALKADLETAKSAVAMAVDALQEAKLLAHGSDQSVTELAARVEEAEEFHAKIAERDKAHREHAAATKLLVEFRAAQSERAWPSLEQGAGALLSETTEGRYGDVRMTTDFKLEVIDRGEWFGLERYSGGEQDLANLCLRLAIADWVARERETELGVVVLDEVFGSQDEDRRNRLLVALRSLEARFHQLLVITHVPEIADLCDHQLVVSLAAPGQSVAEVVSE